MRSVAGRVAGDRLQKCREKLFWRNFEVFKIIQFGFSLFTVRSTHFQPSKRLALGEFSVKKLINQLNIQQGKHRMSFLATMLDERPRVWIKWSHHMKRFANRMRHQGAPLIRLDNLSLERAAGRSRPKKPHRSQTGNTKWTEFWTLEPKITIFSNLKN